MSAEALIMFIVGAIFLWGGLALSIANYLRVGQRGGGGTADSRQNRG